MRIVGWAMGGVALACLEGACGEDAEPPPGPRVPLQHRVVATVCDRERPRGGPTNWSFRPNPQAGAATCTTDADCSVPESCAGCRAACLRLDAGKLCLTSAPGGCWRDTHCTEGENGRCVDQSGPVCTYDECFTDDECNLGGPCECEATYQSGANVCLLGDCRTDADCGGGYCSPTFGCGDSAGVVGYDCHTPEDTCIDDADCGAPITGGFCLYRPEVAHWACAYGQQCLSLE
jgi:hypothetical protein